MLERIADIAGRAHDAQVDRATVRGQVVGHERVHRRTHGIRHGRTHRLARLHALGDACAPRPPGRAQQGHVDLGRLTGALAMEQCSGDPARDVHPADRVAERGNALRQSAAQFLGRQCMAHSAARPERGAVEASGVPFRSLVAVGAAARVDDLRVHRANVLDVELVLLTLCGHVVRQEHVGGLGDLVQDFLAARSGHVDTDASLTAIGMLDQRVPVRVELEAAHVDEAALGVAAHRMLHLDDVCAPVSEDRPRRWNERELCNFEDANALHHLDQVSPLSALLNYPTVMFTVDRPAVSDCTRCR